MTQANPPLPVIPANLVAYAEKHPEFMDAVMFATLAHADQVRKYTNDPYINHPLEVASILYDAIMRYDMCEHLELHKYPEIMVAAVLHDTVEDCNVTYTEIERRFGIKARDLVFWLTDVTTHAQGNRATRKELEAVRLGYAPLQAKIIKLADMLSNTRSILAHDPNFAQVYLREKEDVLSQMHWSFPAEVDPLCFPEVFAYLYQQVKDQVIKRS